MKIAILYLCFVFTSISVFAQEPEIKNPKPKKFYVGVDINVTPYYLKYNSSQFTPFLYAATFTPYPGIHVGYHLSKRARLQVGAAYATDRFKFGGEYNNNGVTQGTFEVVKTKGFIIPVSFRYDFLDVSKRFQAYGFATLTTAYSHSNLTNTTTQEGVVTNRYKANQSAVGLSLDLGLGMSYRLNNRFSVFGEYSVINRNLTGGYNPNRRGLDIGLLNLGLNYKF